jgi:hypothetical protein
MILACPRCLANFFMSKDVDGSSRSSRMKDSIRTSYKSLSIRPTQPHQRLHTFALTNPLNPADLSATLLSSFLALLNGLPCLDDAFDPTSDAGLASRRRLNGFLDSELLVELSVSLLFLSRRGDGEVVIAAAAVAVLVGCSCDGDLRLLSPSTSVFSDRGLPRWTSGAASALSSSSSDTFLNSCCLRRGGDWVRVFA